jgi:DNA-binding transcriptional LysR family regulator
MTANFDILKSLEIFLHVADTGSMTTAARRMGVTQSAISQQIKLLEAELGTPLFDRQIRPLRLTSAGNTLHLRAGHLVLDARETWVHVRQAAETMVPHLRLAMLSTLAHALVPALIAAVEARELGLQAISVMRGVSHNHARDLINREIDVAVTSDAIYKHESIDRHELVRERYVVLLPRAFADRGDDLRVISAKLPFIRFTSRLQSGQLIEQHFRRLRLEITTKYAFESPQDLIDGVGSGYGWSVVTPSQLAFSPVDISKLRILPFPKPGLSRSITLIARKGELQNVTLQLARLCCKVIRKEILPKVNAVLPGVSDAFTLVGEDWPDVQNL